MNELKIFESEDFGSIRTIQDEKGKILFCGSDVARALGYARPNNAVNTHCKSKDALKQGTLTNGGIQEILFIPESDVYRLIIKSKLPQAEKFEAWVFEEVIPSIREHGGYIANQENLSDEDLLAKAMLVAQNVINTQKTQIHELETKIEQDKSKVLFAESISSSEDAISVEVFAKILTRNGFEIGQNRLFRWFKENKYLAGNNLPYQKYMNMNLFEVSETPYMDFYGEYRVFWKTLITPKGQEYFIKKFNKAQRIELVDKIFSKFEIE